MLWFLNLYFRIISHIDIKEKNDRLSIYICRFKYKYTCKLILISWMKFWKSYFSRDSNVNLSFLNKEIIIKAMKQILIRWILQNCLNFNKSQLMSAIYHQKIILWVNFEFFIILWISFPEKRFNRSFRILLIMRCLNSCEKLIKE